jgi:hypothetical protein
MKPGVEFPLGAEPLRKLAGSGPLFFGAVPGSHFETAHAFFCFFFEPFPKTEVLGKTPL